MNAKSLLLRALRFYPLTEGAMEKLLFKMRIREAAPIRERARVAARLLRGQGVEVGLFSEGWKWSEEFLLRGQGVEIGALHLPMKLPRAARVRYVDRFDTAAARRTFPELKWHDLVEVDVVDDGERLDKFAAQSVDFIIANHMIEHCENPLGTLENWLGKLKPQGIIFMAVPDRARTFDRERQVTSVEHLLQDWRVGGEQSLPEHYRDWARNVARLEGEALENYARELLERRENIHFHTWRLSNFVEMLLVFERQLSAQNAISQTFVLEHCATNADEFLVVLRKLEQEITDFRTQTISLVGS